MFVFPKGPCAKCFVWDAQRVARSPHPRVVGCGEVEGRRSGADAKWGARVDDVGEACIDAVGPSRSERVAQSEETCPAADRHRVGTAGDPGVPVHMERSPKRRSRLGTHVPLQERARRCVDAIGHGRACFRLSEPLMRVGAPAGDKGCPILLLRAPCRAIPVAERSRHAKRQRAILQHAADEPKLEPRIVAVARHEVVVVDPETSGTAVAARIVVQHVRERRDSCVLRTIAAPAPHVLAGATGGSRTQPNSVKNPLTRAGPHLKLQVVRRFAAAR